MNILINFKGTVYTINKLFESCTAAHFTEFIPWVFLPEGDEPPYQYVGQVNRNKLF